MSAAMTETHTPLRLNAGDETRIMEDRPDGVCLPVCDVKCGGMSGRTVKEGEALATRIVQAVNSHHDLIEALTDVGASLAAAISLLERGGKAAKKAAPSDRMFDQMVKDYKASLERTRAILTKEAGRG